MKKIRIAICDKDAEYTRQLVNYIAIKEGDSFEVLGFPNETLYQKDKIGFDVLLYEETFFQNEEETEKVEKAICLSNGGILHGRGRKLCTPLIRRRICILTLWNRYENVYSKIWI